MLSESLLLADSLGFFIPGLYLVMLPPLVLVRLRSLVGVPFPILSKYSAKSLTLPGFWRLPELFCPPWAAHRGTLSGFRCR